MRPCERNWKRHEVGQFREIEPMIDDQYGILWQSDDHVSINDERLSGRGERLLPFQPRSHFQVPA